MAPIIRSIVKLKPAVWSFSLANKGSNKISRFLTLSEPRAVSTVISPNVRESSTTKAASYAQRVGMAAARVAAPGDMSFKGLIMPPKMIMGRRTIGMRPRAISFLFLNGEANADTNRPTHVPLIDETTRYNRMVENGALSLQNMKTIARRTRHWEKFKKTPTDSFDIK